MYWHMPLEDYSVVIKYVDIETVGSASWKTSYFLGMRTAVGITEPTKIPTWHSVILIHLGQNRGIPGASWMSRLTECMSSWPSEKT